MDTETSKWEYRLWNILPLLTALVTAYAAIKSEYALHSRGPSPEKQLELDLAKYWINPAKDLGPLGEKVRVSVTINSNTYDRIIIGGFSVKNSGKSPILPADFHKPFAVVVDPPWKIIAVENGHQVFGNPNTLTGGKTPVLLEWTKISPSRFESSAALINPGDQFYQTIYLTSDNTNDVGGRYPQDVPVRIEARIENLQGFTYVPNEDLLKQILGKMPKFVVIHLQDGGVIFLLVSASLFLACYLTLLHRGGFFKRSKLKWQAALTVFAAAMSYSAAEVVADWACTSYFSEKSSL